MSNLYLVGFMGAGKSAVGRALAERLGRPFLDLDELIEQRVGMPIGELVACRGEPAFRQAEREALEGVGRLGGAVVAAGGGAFAQPGNREVMHADGGRSVFLDVPWPVLAERLRTDHGGRPLWSDESEARRLYAARRPHYLGATWTLALDGSETPSEVAERVASLVSGAAGAT
jgi:shikimate kinase